MPKASTSGRMLEGARSSPCAWRLAVITCSSGDRVATEQRLAPLPVGGVGRYSPTTRVQIARYCDARRCRREPRSTRRRLPSSGFQRGPGLPSSGARGWSPDAELARTRATVVVGEAGVRLHVGGRRSASRRPEAHGFVGALRRASGARFGQAGSSARCLWRSAPASCRRTSRRGATT